MQGEVNATAVAEQLVAEEADEAAKAAARKAKKQKAKARKQQARSDAAAASEPSAKTSMQSEQDVEHTATVPQSSPSASRGGGSLSDQDTVGPQSQLQHKIAQDSAVYALPDQATLDEPRVASAAVAVGSPSTGAAAVEASQGADATFLDQLFCCPLTKVKLAQPPGSTPTTRLLVTLPAPLPRRTLPQRRPPPRLRPGPHPQTELATVTDTASP